MTQVNYNDGKWHGWNGGECPVHPETTVHLVLMGRDNQSGRVGDTDAGSWLWQHKDPSFNIIAFRVIKEHREPAEAWRDDTGCFWDTPQEALRYGEKATLFREVLE